MAKKDFFKNIKSIFIVEEESTGTKKPTPTASPAAKKAPTKVPVAKTPMPPRVPESKVGAKGTVTGKFTQVLFDALEKNNLEGFDYLEYKESLQSLEKMPMDEATKFKSAFAMAQTMGVTLPKLVQSAEHYLKVLQTEEQKFEQALANQLQSRLGSKQTEIKKLQKQNAEIEVQLKKLQEQAAANKKRINKLQGELTTDQSKVETTKNNFIASFNNLVAQIHADVERMKQYLK